MNELKQDLFFQLAHTVIDQLSNDQLRVLRVMAHLEIKNREDERNLANSVAIPKK